MRTWRRRQRPRARAGRGAGEAAAAAVEGAGGEPNCVTRVRGTFSSDGRRTEDSDVKVGLTLFPPPSRGQ